jgi:hypothetical protein
MLGIFFVLQLAIPVFTYLKLKAKTWALPKPTKGGNP